ncbi:MAG: HlyD family secretion protein [Gemmataceae bacterium]|nr:HlyD family secretion protein [Gemmataceae bacterium]
MSTSRVLPRPTYHLRVFAVCLAAVVLCLAGFLFGVHLEAVTPATGIITARDQEEIRARRNGLVEPGWYEGDLLRTDGSRLAVRLDSHGNGRGDPTQERAATVQHYRLADGSGGVRREELRFHRLQPGDELWPGQVVATVYPHKEQDKKKDRHKASEDPGASFPFFLFPAPSQPVMQAVVRVPETAACWLILDVRVAPFQAVQAGEVIATVVPVDPQTHQPRDLMARLDVDEKHFGDVVAGQTVRLYSSMFNHRLHGYAEARIERLEPLGEATPDGGRRFHVVAPVTSAPFAMPLGSSFKAEIVVGRKRVYRIILEH